MVLRPQAYLDTLIQSQEQTITDEPCEGSSVLLDDSYNFLMLEMTAEMWHKIYSSLQQGAELTYPDESHEILWAWLKTVECVMSFCEKIIDCIESDVPTRRAFADAIVLPIGTILTYITTDAPAHTLPLAGGSYLRVDYPLLYAVLSSEFIIDADNFTLPDLTQRFQLAKGDSDLNLGDIGGEAEHTLTLGEIPSHSHNYTRADAAENLYAAGANFAIRNRSTQATQAVGGDEPHNNMPPYLVVAYCIVAE